MIELNIPGLEPIQLRHLVCDVNGTLALDGRLEPELTKRLRDLSDRLNIHLVTADTHGRQEAIDQRLGIKAERIAPEDEGAAKARFVGSLGAESVIAFGQGANDAEMLAAAGVGVAVMSKEGLALQTLNAADLVMPDIHAALDLVEKPLRLVASLRR
ncbi:MAG: HAD family hydrolase [Anaerolineales bacterium]